MASVPSPFLTPEQYLEIDRRAERPSEYCDGAMYEVVNTTARHSFISVNLVVALSSKLGTSKCRILASIVRVRVPRNRYAYPDVVVTCGSIDFEDKERDTLKNPTVIFEILSPSTADYDRGTKSDWYRSIPSLKAYVIIAQDRAFITRYSRQADDQWFIQDLRNVSDCLDLESIHCSLPLAEIYHDIELDDPATLD